MLLLRIAPLVLRTGYASSRRTARATRLRFTATSYRASYRSLPLVAGGLTRQATARYRLCGSQRTSRRTRVAGLPERLAAGAA